jgi:hypothetical protein
MSAPAFSLGEGKWSVDINLTSINQNSTYGGGQKYNEENFGLGTSYG